MKNESLNKIEKISLRLFYVFMPLCALFFLATLWMGFVLENESDIMFIITVTLFVIGFASFLVWLPIMIYQLLEILRSK